MAFFREAERTPILIEEIFLLKTDPQVGIVLDRGAHVGGMRGAIGVHDFAQDDISVLAAGIRIQSHGLQNAVGAFALRLHGGTAVKTPKGQIRKRRRLLKRLDRSFAAQLRNGLFAVKPDIFKFVFCHGIWWISLMK